MRDARGRAWTRFAAIALPVFRSPVRRRVLGLSALLAALLLSVNGLNVLNSYVGRDFMTALAARSPGRFGSLAAVYAAVFLATAAVAVLYRFAEERLGLLWRAWLTGDLVDRYLAGRSYARIRAEGRPDNPDQRISEDVRAFTSATLSLVLIFSNAAITLFAFVGVLWSISPRLLPAAGLYAAFGTGATLLVGRRLVGLNVEQLRREADFRFGLVRVREHADAVALLGGEPDESRRLRRLLGRAVANMRDVIAVNRNLGFFTAGYGYLTQLVPVLVVAPLYLRGELEFGAVTQSAVAFGHVLGAVSLGVTEFQRLAAFAAVVERVGGLWDAVTGPPEEGGGIAIAEEPDRLAFEDVTLSAPGGRVLVRDLSVEVAAGRSLLIRGPTGTGRTALIRAAAGLRTPGSGRIVRPPGRRVAFVPQRPYLTDGTLRDQLVYGLPGGPPPDARLLDVARSLRLGAVLGRVGGLDGAGDWRGVLSEGEQQAVALARLLVAAPAFALLDEPTAALDADAVRAFYGLLARSGIAYATAANDPALVAFHDRVLDLRPDGTWTVAAAR